MAKRSELAQQLLASLRKQKVLSAGNRVGVGVSGGADSVALLRLLLELRGNLGIVLCVVHFNHQLRGKASNADEKFVEKLAAQHELEFFVAREDVGAKAKRERANLEDAGRRARYAFFESLVGEGRITKIAVAHTADDQAETVLAHILRGTGLAGLGGIHPQAGVVFRPLLQFRRAQLRLYLRAKRQTWREDATNRDTKRMRARIRRKLLPMLEKQFQPATVEHLCQLAELARDDEAFLEQQANAWFSRTNPAARNEARIELAEFLESHVALRRRLVRTIVENIKPRGGQLSAAHVAAVLDLAQQPNSGKILQLPGGLEVLRERDALRFRATGNQQARAHTKPGSNEFCYDVDFRSGNADVRVVELLSVLRFRVIDWLPEGRETKLTGAVLDRDRLCLPLVVRNWREGDAFQPFGHQKSHKLARLLNEMGVSRWDKLGWPVLTSGSKIAWAKGLPVAVEFAAGSGTRTGVVISEERES